MMRRLALALLLVLRAVSAQAERDYLLQPRQIAADTWVLEGRLEDFSFSNGGNIVNRSVQRQQRMKEPRTAPDTSRPSFVRPRRDPSLWPSEHWPSSQKDTRTLARPWSQPSPPLKTPPLTC